MKSHKQNLYELHFFIYEVIANWRVSYRESRGGGKEKKKGTKRVCMDNKKV